MALSLRSRRDRPQQYGSSVHGGAPVLGHRGQARGHAGKASQGAGKAAPWRHAYLANLSGLRGSGSFRVRVGKLTSRPWVGYGPRAPKHTHHWSFVPDGELPDGAVVGGPAPPGEIRSQDFRPRDRFGTRFAAYEDRRADHVTSEPAVDYAASSILLLAALEGPC